MLLDGTRIQATNNVNESYFNNPAYNAKMERAARLSGGARLTAYGNLDADIIEEPGAAGAVHQHERTALRLAGPRLLQLLGVNASTNLVGVCKK